MRGSFKDARDHAVWAEPNIDLNTKGIYKYIEIILLAILVHRVNMDRHEEVRKTAE